MSLLRYTEKCLFEAYVEVSTDMDFPKSVEIFKEVYKDYLEHPPATLTKMYQVWLLSQNSNTTTKARPSKSKINNPSQLNLFA